MPENSMRNKLIAGFALLLWTISILSVGFYGAFFLVSGLEMNDRLKYEAAYLRGYVSAQTDLKEGDAAGAERDLDFLIDAHAKTLTEFRYVASSDLKREIDRALCKVVDLRSRYPAIRDYSNSDVSIWYEELDAALRADSVGCEGT